jgi:LPS export ABC transporter protein LptC
MATIRRLIYVIVGIVVLGGCSFNYDDESAKEFTLPEISFEKLDYTRVKDGHRLAHLTAEQGDQYDKKHIMEIKDYRFEQFERDTEKVDATGNGGSASIDMQSSDVDMTNDVTVKVDSEDYNLHATDLRWDDEEKHLSTGDETPVKVTRSNGTVVNGKGLSADVRSRTWTFRSGVDGTYVNDEDDEDTTADKKKTPVTPPATSAKTPATKTDKGARMNTHEPKAPQSVILPEPASNGD